MFLIYHKVTIIFKTVYNFTLAAIRIGVPCFSLGVTFLHG